MVIKFDHRFEGLEKDPVFLRKRKATLICFFIRMFLLGAEYAIILPSIWLYLKRFGVKTWYLGIVIAVYPTAAVLSLPVVGRIFDKTKRTKELILVLNLFEIIGNIIYALPFSKWFIFCGRFLAGLGDGFFACATSEIVHTYPLSSRTGALALLELGRVLGLTFGPALNFFLVKVDFKIGALTIDNGTSPGFFMAILWILAQILTMFYVSNLSLLIEERAKYQPNIQLDVKIPPPRDYEIDYKRVRETSLCESVLDVTYGDEQPLLSNNYKPYFKCYKSATGKTFIDDHLTEDDEFFPEDEDSNVPTSAMEDSIQIVSKKSYLKQMLELICTVEIIAIFYSDLILSLIQTEFEVFLPLLTQEGYGWGETETSGVYMVGGVWLMFVFFLLYKFSDKSKIKDQHYMVISLILTTFALLLLMFEVIESTKMKLRVAIFCVICLFVFSAIPLNLVAAKSLVTKLTPRETQGVTQAVYSSISRVSLILGPILAASAFSHRLVFSAIMGCMCIIGLIAMVLLLRKIRKKIATMQEMSG